MVRAACTCACMSSLFPSTTLAWKLSSPTASIPNCTARRKHAITAVMRSRTSTSTRRTKLVMPNAKAL
eukprot:scaffold2135_cov341-Prasinococcus_capsulatus_cf.AAC.10